MASADAMNEARLAAMAKAAQTPVPEPTPVAATAVAAPDPTKTAYTDLTPAQRAAMSSTEKKDYIKAAREAEMAADAAARAASDPMLNFQVRPEAPAADNEFLYYYSWVGGVNNGSWKLYRAANNEVGQAMYGGRTEGGATQATASSAIGANSLKTPGANAATTATTATTTATTASTASTTASTAATTSSTTSSVTATVTATASVTSSTTGLTKADLDRAVSEALAKQAAANAAAAREAKAAEDAAKLAQKVKASDRLTAMFSAYDLGSLSGFINRRIMADVSEEMLLLELYDQPEYQLRFPGMKALRAKGKTITEAEYIKDEKAFIQTARFFDVPVGFYDSPDDFGKLIGNLVAPKEFQDRLQVGQDLARSMSPGLRTQLQELYNVGEGGITAYVLDADRALPLIQKQAKAAQFVGFGREKGFKLEGITAAQAEQIAGTEAYAKLSAQQMQTALGQAAQLRQTQSRLTGIEGEVYNEGEALKAVIEGSPEAILASQQRAQREGARFGGGSGVTGSSLRSSTMI